MQNGGTPLQNARYERMAQELFKGAKAIDAHERAGFSRNSGNAARMNGLECIQTRVAELQAQVAARIVDKTAVIDAGYVKQQAHRMYVASAKAAVSEDDDGNVAFDPKAANVAARFLEQVGNHRDVAAFTRQTDINISITVDQAIGRLARLDTEAIEADYTDVTSDE